MFLILRQIRMTKVIFNMENKYLKEYKWWEESTSEKIALKVDPFVFLEEFYDILFESFGLNDLELRVMIYNKLVVLSSFNQSEITHLRAVGFTV